MHHERTQPNSSKIVFSTCTALNMGFLQYTELKRILDRSSFFAMLSRRLNTAIL